MSVPCSPKDKLEGILWLPRMLDKARKHGEGTLHEDYHPNLGKGHDERCCKFLKVRYADVVEQIDQGLTNSEMVNWCFEIRFSAQICVLLSEVTYDHNAFAST